MSEQGNREPGVTGEADHDQHRAGEGQGVRAPSVDESGVSEISVFDGAGNESIVRTVTDESGKRVQGTGPTSEAAASDAEELLKDDSGQDIGDAFGPVHEST